MAMDNNLRISVEILKCYVSGFSSLIIEGPNNDFPTKITSNWPWSTFNHHCIYIYIYMCVCVCVCVLNTSG